MNPTCALPQGEIHPTHMEIAEHREVDQTCTHFHQLPFAYALAEASEPHAYKEGCWRDSIASASDSTQTVADDIEWARAHQSREVFFPPSVSASLTLKGQGTVLPTRSPKKDEASKERRSLVVGKAVLEIF